MNLNSAQNMASKLRLSDKKLFMFSKLFLEFFFYYKKLNI